MAIHKMRKYKQLLDIRDAKQWCYYNQCGCNEADAVSRRHVKVVSVDPEDAVYTTANKICTSTAIRFRNSFVYSKWNHKQLIDNTSQDKKARYNKAYTNLKTGSVNWRTFADGKAFIKFEKMPQLKADDRAPGRLIQYRSFEYTYLLKSYLGPVWEQLKASECVINDNTGQKFKEVFTSGMSYDEVGRLVTNLWSRHLDCIALCIDHSFFDGHHHKYNLELEHKFWNSVVQSKFLKWLLKKQFKNRMTCKISRSKFVSEATRLSGDWTTSAGNSIINFLMLRTVFGNASIVVNGDDSIVFIARKDLEKLCGGTSMDVVTKWVKTQFARFGQQTKLDRMAGIIEQIEYCQCSPVKFSDGYRMVRSPLRCLGRVQYTSHINMDPRTYYSSVGLCELACNPGVPIMQNFSLNLIQRGNGRLATSLLTEGLHYVSDEDLKLKVKPIDSVTRQSFYLAFGYTEEHQQRLEKYFTNSGIPVDRELWMKRSGKIVASNRLQRR